jgi:hypothetical protein
MSKSHFLYFLILFFSFGFLTHSESINAQTNPVSGAKNATLGFSSSNLPIVIINTENRVPIVDEPKVKANLGIISNPEGQLNRITDAPNHYNGNIGIELRGNSTQGFPKKPYNLKTLDAQGQSNNFALFGFPPENDWVLQASYLDHTFIRNPLAMHLSRQLGRWASRTQMVEMVLNGEYQGIYIFMEKIKVDKGRLDIATLKPDEITEPDISGGYIWEVTGFDNNLGEQRNLKYPELSEAAPEQIDYITRFDDGFRSSMFSEEYTNETTGYPAWIDFDSFVDELLVQEAMRNSDAYGWSGYFHKDKEGKINAGPVWDFDQSAGNSSYPDDGVISGWMFAHPSTSNTPFFWPKLYKDPKFAYKVKLRWQTARQSIFKTENLLQYIDSLASLLSVSQSREFQQWPVLGQNFWRETQGFENRTTYAKEVTYLKDFLTKRWAWIDDELAKVKNPVTGVDEVLSETETIRVYPNPAKNKIQFEFFESKASIGKISIYNNLGGLVQTTTISGLSEGYNTIAINFESNYKPGFYIYKIQLNNEVKYTGKFIRIE